MKSCRYKASFIKLDVDVMVVGVIASNDSD